MATVRTGVSPSSSMDECSYASEEIDGGLAAFDAHGP